MCQPFRSQVGVATAFFFLFYLGLSGCSESNTNGELAPTAANTSPKVAPSEPLRSEQRSPASTLAVDVEPARSTQQETVAPELSPSERQLDTARRTMAVNVRINAVMQSVVAAPPTSAEETLISSIAQQQQVYELLAAELAQDATNPTRSDLVMPWETRGLPDLLNQRPGQTVFRRRSSALAQVITARVGNEELRAIELGLRENQFAVANLRALRVWEQLSETERTECTQFQPDFADEASGQNARQLSEFDQRLAANPDDAALLAQRADLHWRRGNLSAAVVDYERSLDLRPADADAIRLRLAQLTEAIGDTEAALREYRLVGLAQSTSSATALVRLGYLLLDGEELEQALLVVQQAIELDPHFAPTHTMAAEVYRRIGMQNKLIESLLTAVKIAPEDPAGHYRLANVYSQLQQADQAIAEYTVAIELNPTWWRPRMGRATLLFKKGEVEAALADATEAKVWAPTEVRVLKDRVFLLETLGRSEEAAVDRETI